MDAGKHVNEVEKIGSGSVGRSAGVSAKGSAYLFLLALQIAGAAVILWHGVPIYRSFLPGKTYQPLDPVTAAWAFTGVVLLQVPYWISTLKVFPFLPPPRHAPPGAFLGHVVLFLARLSFIFASSLFVVIVLARGDDIEFVWWRALLLAAVLFAMFCFTLELERFGRRLFGE